MRAPSNKTPNLKTHPHTILLKGGTGWPTCRSCCPRCRKANYSRCIVCAPRAATPACGRFCISGRKTCMSARHFHRSAGPFTISLFHFHYAPGRRFLHLEPQNLHVGSRFLHVGPPILRVRCALAPPTDFFAPRTANPACRLTFLHVGQTYPR